MPAGRYLLGAGHRVRVPLHQLLERDGLRVRSAGDLQTRENQSSLRIPPSPSFPPSLGSYCRAGVLGGERAAPLPPRALPPLFTTRGEAASSPRGAPHLHSCVCPAQSQIPAGKGQAVQRGLRAHTWAAQMRWVSRNRADRPAPPRSRVYSRAVLLFCLTSELASVY